MKKLTLPALFAAGTLVLVGCAGQPAATTPGADGQLKSVTIGTLPIIPTAAIHLGIEKGFFKEEGLDVKIETGQGGAALVPAIVSGTMQFATGNGVSLLQARDKGLDVRVIASYTYDTPKGVHGIVVKKDSGINSCKDLAGKSVAVNTLKSLGDLHLDDAVEKQGGDPKTVKYVEMGFPQMPAALAQGNVDAIWTPEPFLTMAQDQGNKVACWNGVESVEGHPTMLFFTSGTMVNSDKPTVDAMRRAINKTMDYAQQHPDEVRAEAVAKMKITEDVAKKMVLEDFGGPIRREQIAAEGALMTKYGFISKPADVDGLLQSSSEG